MTTAELYEVLYTTRSMMDQILEFWLTASFAVVVASHFLGPRLSRPIAFLLSSVYALFSLLLGVRYGVTIVKTVEIRDRLLEAGEQLSVGAGNLVGVLSAMTFLVGFGAVLFFVHRSSSNAEEVDSDVGK